MQNYTTAHPSQLIASQPAPKQCNANRAPTSKLLCAASSMRLQSRPEPAPTSWTRRIEPIAPGKPAGRVSPRLCARSHTRPWPVCRNGGWHRRGHVLGTRRNQRARERLRRPYTACIHTERRASLPPEKCSLRISRPRRLLCFRARSPSASRVLISARAHFFRRQTIYGDGWAEVRDSSGFGTFWERPLSRAARCGCAVAVYEVFARVGLC